VSNLSLDIRALREAAENIEFAQKTIAKASMETKLADYAAYTERRGEYYGLNKALLILQDVEKRLSK
jgi:hypothetical protein